jgi:dTDP-4-amino-4,6-dideoxygalactose transaminase
MSNNNFVSKIYNLRLTFFRGRVALYTVLSALGIGKDDQVAIQAFTCIAVPEAIIACGASPLYIDVTPMGVNLDPEDLEKKITPKTKAIVIQHTFGVPAEMNKILHIANEAGIPVVEDCCHTLLSTYRDKVVGGFGIASFYSFEWGKPVVAGIGGGLQVNDPKLQQTIEQNYELYTYPDPITDLKLNLQYLAYKILLRPSFYWKLRDFYHLLSDFKMIKGSYNPIGKDSGDIAKDFSFRMSISTLKRLKQELQHLSTMTSYTNWVIEQYQSKIISTNFIPVNQPEFSKVVFARYPLLCPDKQRLLSQAQKLNVEIADWYSTPVHPLQNNEWHLVDYEAQSCPNAEQVSSMIVSLPVGIRVKQKDIDNAVNLINGLN